jgi:hypothetical protein
LLLKREARRFLEEKKSAFPPPLEISETVHISTSGVAFFACLGIFSGVTIYMLYFTRSSKSPQCLSIFSRGILYSNYRLIFVSLNISLKNVQGRVSDEEHHLAELQLELEPFQQALDTHR